jgi:exodeoxyribonuclease VII small subunit
MKEHTKMSDNPSFEDALAELEDIVARLETGDLTLEESLATFERGQQLAALCNSVLDQAELRLEQIGSEPSSFSPED